MAIAPGTKPGLQAPALRRQSHLRSRPAIVVPGDAAKELHRDDIR